MPDIPGTGRHLMANEQLKNALRQAGITAEQFAEIIQVDPKTVQRWIAGRTPYPRYRHTIARALDIPEHQLWPNTATPAGSTGQPPAEAYEVMGAWGYLDDPRAPDPAALIAEADGPIDLLDNGRGIRLDRTIAEAILEHASVERPVRILTYLPNRRLEPLVGRQHIEIGVIDPSPAHSLLRTGETMLVTFDLPTTGYQPPPLIYLHRNTDNGLYDRLSENLDTLWEDIAEILTDAKQLDRYRTNTDEDQDDDDQDGDEDRPDPENPPARSPLAPTDPDNTPRHWPRRPA